MTSDPSTIGLQYGAQREGRRTDPTMNQFRHDRFGQFLHWGLYSIPAGVWQGTDHGFAAEFLAKSAKIPPAEWARLAEQFTAESFDPVGWAQMAKAMGARYVTITTKHHEGFCLWPSDTTDFTVANTPFGRDALAEIIAAYQAEGLAVHLYFSVLDWSNPDWRYRIETAEDATAMARCLDVAKAQLRELAVRYPTVRGFWFDGTWDESVKANGWWTLEIEQMLKELVPGAIVNSRLRADDLGARHFDSQGRLMGDYESAFERRLPDPWDTSVLEHDWEACMTIPYVSWGHHVGASVAASRKSPTQILEQIVHAVSCGGNLLLNFGPAGDGSIAAFEHEMADEIGAWFDVNAEVVHGGGPAVGWTYPSWGHYIRSADSDDVYAVVTRAPVSGTVVIQPPRGEAVHEVVPVDPRLQVTTRTDQGQISILLPTDRLDHPVAFRLLTRESVTAGFTEPNPDLE